MDFYITDSYSSTSNLTFSDIHISVYCHSRPVHSEVRQQHTLLLYFIAFSPYLFNPRTMIYTPHRVGFRQPDCYGKFSRQLAELITRFSLLNRVLFDAGEAFQSVTSSFDSLIISFNLNHKLCLHIKVFVHHFLLPFPPQTLVLLGITPSLHLLE